MARMHQWIGLAVLTAGLTGCVSLDKYNAMKLDRDQQAMGLTKAQSDARAAQAEADLLKKQLEAINRNGVDGNALSANQRQQIADLERQLADAERRVREALEKAGQTVTMLPPELNNELKAFAAANPDLVEFDSARGVVKFKSDLTFSTGSAEVTDKAKTAIQRFATILNSQAAVAYELKIDGHTDSDPVANPNTIKAGHPDNWYLSAHRAIAVSKTLQASQVSGKRIGIAGYADNRPVASNASTAGKAQNRRVEVLILPTTTSTASAAPVRPAVAPKAAPKLNKDTTAADHRPVYNK